MAEFNSITNQLALIDIYTLFHVKAELTFFSSVELMSWKVAYVAYVRGSQGSAH